ncbi:MAG: hypothetical protein ACTSPB_10850 [Candidatus Thorarchaeota archaeon]
MDNLLRDIQDFIDLKSKHDQANLDAFIAKQDLKFELMHMRYVKGMDKDSIWAFLQIAASSKVSGYDYRKAIDLSNAFIEHWGTTEMMNRSVHISHARNIKMSPDNAIEHSRAIAKMINLAVETL